MVNYISMSLSHPENMAYEQHVLKGEQKQLKYYAERSNQQQEQHEQDQLLVNMSIKQILMNWSQTFVNILTDLATGQITGVRSLITTLFKEDRMIYVGLTMILIAFSMYIVDITS